MHGTIVGRYNSEVMHAWKVLWQHAGCCSVLPSLLDFRPEQYGLPAFGDMINGVVPLEPVWRLKGKVVKGFGRGSKELGIPTANLDAASLQVASASVSSVHLSVEKYVYSTAGVFGSCRSSLSQSGTFAV